MPTIIEPAPIAAILPRPAVLAAAGSPPSFSVQELRAAQDRYRWRPYCPSLLPVMPAALAFRQAVLDRARPRWLTLLGPSGVGKTMLLMRLFRELAQARRWDVCDSAHVIPSRDLDTWQAAGDYGRMKMVYVEDIGAGAQRGAGAVVTSRVAELLQARTGKWTLLCANLSLDAVGQLLDGRIQSRIVRDGSLLVEIDPHTPDFWRVA